MVSMCWAPIEGTPLSAVTVMDPASQAKVEAMAASAFPSAVRAAAIKLSATRALPAGYPDVYHRLDLWDPVAVGRGAPPTSAAAVYRDYFALHLAPRAFQEVARFGRMSESAATVKAISALTATGPNSTHQLPEDAESGGDALLPASLAAALPAGGLSETALRDLQIARHLTALWNASSWGSAGKGWQVGVQTAGIGMESGVWYTWPARQIPGEGSDVQDQLWYARAVQMPGQLVVSREHPCPKGCVGQESFLAPFHITLSLAFTDVAVNGSAVRMLRARCLLQCMHTRCLRTRMHTAHKQTDMRDKFLISDMGPCHPFPSPSRAILRLTTLSRRWRQSWGS